MFQLILQDLMSPLLRRAGTGTSMFLTGMGVATADAELIAVGLTTGISVMAELLASGKSRRKIRDSLGKL